MFYSFAIKYIQLCATTDTIFRMHQLQQKYKSKKKDIYFMSVGLSQMHQDKKNFSKRILIFCLRAALINFLQHLLHSKIWNVIINLSKKPNIIIFGGMISQNGGCMNAINAKV